MIEAQTLEAAFPMVGDVLESVRVSAVESVSGGDTKSLESFADAFTGVFTCNPLEADQPDIALINLIAYAGAAFAVSEVYRSDGNDDQAGLFHVMGQDMLAKAAETVGAFIAIGIRANGLQVH
jgi:hypothetical protein